MAAWQAWPDRTNEPKQLVDTAKPKSTTKARGQQGGQAGQSAGRPAAQTKADITSQTEPAEAIKS